MSGTVFDRWLGRTRTVFEIVAIVGGAIWAYTRFERLEAPSLEQSLQVAANLAWDKGSGPQSCLARFGVDVTNLGKAGVEVDSVRLLVWRRADPDTLRALEYVDPDSFQVGNSPVWERTFTGALVGHYGPEMRSHEDYVFEVPVTQNDFLMFEFRALAHSSGKTDTTFWSDYAWEHPCGSPDRANDLRPVAGGKVRGNLTRPR